VIRLEHLLAKAHLPEGRHAVLCVSQSFGEDSQRIMIGLKPAGIARKFVG
jgi:hypothetical protein